MAKQLWHKLIRKSLVTRRLIPKYRKCVLTALRGKKYSSKKSAVAAIRRIVTKCAGRKLARKTKRRRGG